MLSLSRTWSFSSLRRMKYIYSRVSAVRGGNFRGRRTLAVGFFPKPFFRLSCCVWGPFVDGAVFFSDDRVVHALALGRPNQIRRRRRGQVASCGLQATS